MIKQLTHVKGYKPGDIYFKTRYFGEAEAEEPCDIVSVGSDEEGTKYITVRLASGDIEDILEEDL